MTQPPAVDSVIQPAAPDPAIKPPAADRRDALNPVFARPGESADLPKHKMPDQSMLPETAYQIVHDESMLDGNARLNLATFVSDLDGRARPSVSTPRSFDKNMIDKDEYPPTAAIEDRCWRILADLWNVPDADDSDRHVDDRLVRGVHARRPRVQAAAGSSGAAPSGRPTDKPNLIMSAAVQVVLGEVLQLLGCRAAASSRSALDHKVLDGYDLEKYVDENTIGVVAIMGATYTGLYEPVARIAETLDEIQADDRARHPDPRRRRLRRDGRTVPAAGSRVGLPARAGATPSPRRATSTASSTPALGWVVWREQGSRCRADLIFHVSYLGGDMPTLALNFSRPGAQVLLQYYMFLRLGCRRLSATCSRDSQDVAHYLSSEIAKMGRSHL